MAPKPAPISTPFTALMPIIAAAMSASRRPYTGSPQPTGTPSATTLTRAPHESPLSRSASMKLSKTGTISVWGAKKAF